MSSAFLAVLESSVYNVLTFIHIYFVYVSLYVSFCIGFCHCVLAYSCAALGVYTMSRCKYDCLHNFVFVLVFLIVFWYIRVRR